LWVQAREILSANAIASRESITTARSGIVARSAASRIVSAVSEIVRNRPSNTRSRASKRSRCVVPAGLKISCAPALTGGAPSADET